MAFNSLIFLIFFGVVFCIHQLPLSGRAKKINLLLASYLFYAAWNPPFIVLLWISTAADWFLARWIDAAQSPRRRKVLLVATLAVNLGMLSYFKYGNFLYENAQALLAGFGIHYAAPASSIVLPAGISFYTFQTLSYTIDVYRRTARPWHSFLDYALFVTFFPQLVIGPIVRASEFLPQCVALHRASAREVAWGLHLFLLGLAQKVTLADGLFAPLVDAVYAKPDSVHPIDAWFGVAAYSGQMFFDFAGYSTCALGLGLCLGFRLPLNFRFPYAAVGFSDFWRRWHMSLSHWLRDYLYISLGGSRGSAARTGLNLMITMLLCGFWHGASWLFLVWGGLQGAFLLIEARLKRSVGHMPVWRTPPCRIGLTLFTWLAFALTLIFVRAPDFAHAFGVFSRLVAAPGGEAVFTALDRCAIGAAIGGLLLAHGYLRDRDLESVYERAPWLLRAAAVMLLVMALVFAPGEDRAFIYFQF